MIVRMLMRNYRTAESASRIPFPAFKSCQTVPADPGCSLHKYCRRYSHVLRTDSDCSRSAAEDIPVVGYPAGCSVLTLYGAGAIILIPFSPRFTCLPWSTMITEFPSARRSSITPVTPLSTSANQLREVDAARRKSNTSHMSFSDP